MERLVERSQSKYAGAALDFGGLLELIGMPPAIGWIEVIAENVFGNAALVRTLNHLRPDYGLSLHSVGLSLGSAGGPNPEVLAHLEALNDELAPDLISDHCAWSCSQGIFLNTLLPLPFTRESLDVVCRNVDTVQEVLQRTILIENVSAYLRFREDEMSEGSFLDAVAQRTGCGLLLDVNNLFINGLNHGDNPSDVVARLSARIGAYHLSGHATLDTPDGGILFDEHGGPVEPEVWDVYREAVARWGPRPTFVEWDVASPSLDTLVEEALRADAIIAQIARNGAGA